MPSDYLETSSSLSITFNELHLMVKHTLQSVSNTMTVTSAINIENFGVDLVRAIKASTGAPRVFCWKGSGPAQSQCVFPVVTLRRGSQVPWGWTLAWGGTFSWGSHLGPVRAPAKAPSPWSLVMGRADPQPSVGQHLSLRTQGGTPCPVLGLHLLQRLHCEYNLNHRH